MKDLFIWCGTEDSFKNYRLYLEFCGNAENLNSRIKASFDYDDDDEEFSIGGRMVSFKDDIAIVTISGSLVPSYSFWNQYFDLVSYEEIKSAISLAAENGAKQIILNIDSGGGAVLGLDDCANYIKAVSDKVVPIYAHTSSICASGAYWLASSCKQISGSPMALSGSIGVIAVHLSYADRLKEMGIEATIFRAGEFKALGHPYEKLSEKAAKEIEQRMEQTYSFFLDHVISNRNVSINTKHNWAEGKVFITDDAVNVKLLDNKIYLTQFIEKLRLTNNNRSLSINVSENTENTGSESMARTVKSPEELAALSQGVDVNVSEEVEETEANTDVENDENSNDESTVSDSENSSQEETENDGSDENDESVSSTETTNTTVQGICPKEYAELLAAKTVLEKDLETANLKITEMANDTESLQKIAVAAVNRLQVALHESPTDLTNVSASVVLNTYAEKEKKFNATFKVGSSSSQQVDSVNQNTAEGSGIYPIN